MRKEDKDEMESEDVEGLISRHVSASGWQARSKVLQTWW